MRGRRGAAAVEFALTLPVLAALLVGAVEWGNWLERSMTLEQCTTDAALAASLVDRERDIERTARERLRYCMQLQTFDLDGVRAGARVTSTNAGDLLVLDVALPYEPVVSGVPAPDALRAQQVVYWRQTP
jgi:hypothetical protein